MHAARLARSSCNILSAMRQYPEYHQPCSFADSSSSITMRGGRAWAANPQHLESHRPRVLLTHAHDGLHHDHAPKDSPSAIPNPNVSEELPSLPPSPRLRRFHFVFSHFLRLRAPRFDRPLVVMIRTRSSRYSVATRQHIVNQGGEGGLNRSSIVLLSPCWVVLPRPGVAVFAPCVVRWYERLLRLALHSPRPKSAAE